MNRDTIKEHIKTLREKIAKLETVTKEAAEQAKASRYAIAVLEEEIADLEALIAPKTKTQKGGAGHLQPVKVQVEIPEEDESK